MIIKNQIVGNEVAREYPRGEWVDVNHLPEIAELLVARAGGDLTRVKPEDGSGPSGYRPILGDLGATQVLAGATEVLSGGIGLAELPELQTVSEVEKRRDVPPPEDDDRTVVAPYLDNEDGEATKVVDPTRLSSLHPVLQKKEGLVLTGVGTDVKVDHEDQVVNLANTSANNELAAKIEEARRRGIRPDPEAEEDAYVVPEASARNLSAEKTVVFQRSSTGPAPVGGRKRLTPKEWLRVAAIGLFIGYFGYDSFFGEESNKPAIVKFVPVRPRLPAYVQGKADPDQSQKIYYEAMKLYGADTVMGYKGAAELLLKSSSHDVSNVKALAMLASSYLNLIDSSNKDENYFSVITKLIDLSRSKAVDLTETVIADVEFFVTVNRAEAAQNRIVEYTKTHTPFALEMFYYLAYAFFARGDAQSAARYVAQIPDNKAFSPKVFYLRGLIAEKLGDPATAFQQYERAIGMNKAHARSRLKISEMLARGGRLKEAAPHLDYIMLHPHLLGPKDLALAYYLHSQLNQLYSKFDLALGDIERAVRLDKDNHDYLLELYTLRTKVGDSVQSVQKEARMYYFLSEGEKQLKQGRVQDALTQFLQARQSNDKAFLPFVKIGDMFNNLHDLKQARLNYKDAAALAPKDIGVWSKYINVLIQSYEWEEASKAMDRFRNLPVSQSAIDKAAGDMYARQGQHAEAQMYYKKAMARESIDPEVYIAYAKSLMASKQFKDAPFFFALALRYDPLNMDAIIGTSKSVAATDGIDQGIRLLEDELQKSSGSKAELLAAIAEFQIQKGEWSQAQQFVDQALAVNPDYAYPWKLQAQIHMNNEGLDKNAVDKALAAYKSYSDRNVSDPSGYLERYRMFTKKAEFEKASDELAKIWEIYPKYPNLHYYKGALYGVMGNHKVAADEFKTELANNPKSVTTMVALGKSLVELGQLKGANDLFNQSMGLAPTSADPKHWSGYVNYLMKNYQASIALYNAALMYDKGNPLIYKRLGMAYRDMGDPAGASRSFRKYLEMEPDAVDKAEFERFL